MLGDRVGGVPGGIEAGSSLDGSFFRNLWDSVTDEVLIVDPRFRVRFANQSLVKRLNLPLEEVLNGTCYALLCGRTSPCGQDCLVSSVLQTGAFQTKVYSFPPAEDAASFIEASGYPIVDAAGSVTSVLIVQRDATESVSLKKSHAKLVGAERRKAQESAALVRVAQAIGATLDLGAILEIIREQVTELLHADQCMVLLLSDDGSTLSPSIAIDPDAAIDPDGPSASPRPGDADVVVRTDGVWEFILHSRKVIALNQVAIERAGARKVKAATKSVLVAPLVAKNITLGVLYADVTSSTHIWTGDDKELAAALAHQAALAIDNAKTYLMVKQTAVENARLLETVRQRNRELSALHSIAAAVSKSLSIEEIAGSCVDVITDVVKCDGLALVLRTQSKVSDEFRIVRGVFQALDTLFAKIEVGSPLEEIMQNGEYFLADDVSKHLQFRPWGAKLGPRPLAAIPLRAKSDILGFLFVAGTVRGRFIPEDAKLLEDICNHLAIVIKNAQLHQEVKELAITDGLTSLYNHRFFYERLSEEIERARRFAHPLSLVFADVDNFKSTNDTLGHLQGDTILRELGQIIRRSVRSTDIVARYGGDEFTIVLPETGSSEAVVVAQRLQEMVATYRFSSLGVGGLTISLGVASLDAEMVAATDLVCAADQATYRAKMLGKSQLYVWTGG